MLDSRVMQVQLGSGSGLLGVELLLVQPLLLLLMLQLLLACGQPLGALCHDGRDAQSV
jgi:hypothetical protein